MTISRFGIALLASITAYSACNQVTPMPTSAGPLVLRSANTRDGLAGCYSEDADGGPRICFETARYKLSLLGKWYSGRDYEIALRLTDSSGATRFLLQEGDNCPPNWKSGAGTLGADLMTDPRSFALATRAANALRAIKLDASISREQEIVVQQLAKFARFESIPTEMNGSLQGGAVGPGGPWPTTPVGNSSSLPPSFSSP